MTSTYGARGHMTLSRLHSEVRMFLKTRKDPANRKSKQTPKQFQHPEAEYPANCGVGCELGAVATFLFFDF